MPEAPVEGPYGVIAPDTGLRQRVGQLKPLEDAEIAEIEMTLEQLTPQMDDWLKRDIDRLIMARNAFVLDVDRTETTTNLHRAAHDLKGLGVTYGFPIISVIADTLCSAMQKANDTGQTPHPDLVNAHVDAMRAVVNLNLRNLDESVASELVHGLTAITKKKLAG